MRYVIVYCLFAIGLCLVPIPGNAQNTGTTFSVPPADYEPSDFQAQQLEPLEPGAGKPSPSSESNNMPEPGDTPATQNKLPVQVKPVIFSRVPVRSRL